ncbi:MAG: nitrous oxide reductase accessory protein NosL [Campylobacterales bacterium]|nr:nitrous oxide reductase accessory protein NosL [Campylobacterales bacterium]
MIALDFNASKATCPKCRMGVEHKENSAQVVFEDEKTYIFDDVGCLVLWIEQVKANKETIKMFVYAKDTHRWMDATRAFYSIKDATPMGYGFGGYEKKQQDFIDFDTMTLKMLRGENMSDPKIRKMLLEK